MFEEPFRLHFSNIIEDFFKGFWVLIVILITNLFQSINQLDLNEIRVQDVLISVVLLAVIIGLIFLIMILRWRKTYITLTKETLVIEKLFISKKITTIGLKNISNVDFEQNIFEKLLGTAKLKLDTNSLSTANQNDVKIILKLEKIEQLKRQILLHIDNINKSAQNGNFDVVKENNIVEEALFNKTEKFDIEYDFKKVLQHTLLSIPIFTIIMIIGIVVFFTFTLQNPELSAEFFESFFGSIIALIVIVVPIVYSSIRNIFRLYNFKVKRSEDKIFITYGLFTTKKFTVPVDKINAVVIKQPTIARIFKKYMVEIINVGMVEEAKETPVLLLMCDKKELDETLKTLLPELVFNVRQEKQPKVAIIPISIQVVLLSLIFIIPTLIFMNILQAWGILIISTIIAFAIISGILMYKTRKLAVNKDNVYITQGVFTKKTVIINTSKIQLVMFKNSVLTKALKIQKMRIQILAASINIVHQSGYFKNESDQFKCPFGLFKFKNL